MKTLVTGSSGWIGKAVCSSLQRKHHDVVKTSRTGPYNSETIPLDLSHQTFESDFSDVHTIVHCAAQTSFSGEANEELVAQLWRINVEATKQLALAAKNAGVKRFVFLSSAKVMGESTSVGAPFNENSDYAPEDLYAKSKHEAERVLKDVLQSSETELVIIRPPLVYGPGVKANFRVLMKFANSKIPLPFRMLENKRSLVSLENLADLIVNCVEYEGELNETFLVSDDNDVSTKELLTVLARFYGKKPILFPMPVNLMFASAKLLGKKAIADRLLGNFQMDISHTKHVLNWKPITSFEKSIQKTIAHDTEHTK